MRKFFFLMAIALIIITLLSCGDKVNLLSVIKDAEELQEGARVPFLLFQNYPNPFNGTTRITYQVATNIHLRMKVFTDDWEQVKMLIDREYEPGFYSVIFDGLNSDNEPLPSGEYFYTLEGDGFTQVRKMKIIN